MRQVCDGRNVSMDACGPNPDIPAAAVCHPGGPVPGRWNASCTGCDGAPRPDLPWFPAPPGVNNGFGAGGRKNDACGVCGGQGPLAPRPHTHHRPTPFHALLASRCNPPLPIRRCHQPLQSAIFTGRLNRPF